MWQMYLMTGDEEYKKAAERCEEMLDEVLIDHEKLHHDVGFMWNLTAGVNYRLTGNPLSRRRWLTAASTLAGRFNPNGFIRAWNGDRIGWGIIDCMMNIPLLYRASACIGDPRYKLIAMEHADTNIECFIRPDGSSNHIVCFDPLTGEMLDNPGGQGAYSGSSWSRGQSWALYGFTLSYLATGKEEYLDTAKRVAHYFIANCADDYIPRCDFRQPPQPHIGDNAAGGIAACALLELCQLVPESEGAMYYNVACKMLMAMEKECANWEKVNPAIFMQCSHSYHNVAGRHITMDYGDYYFIEAINKLRGQKKLFWRPHK
jgi:unsaturated chondroitin disaccharide hydrolase